MHGVLIALHVLAAAVWAGGTVAISVVAVPVVRTLEGPARAAALRTLGERWRPLGWGAMAILVLSGSVLAGEHEALRGPLLDSAAGRALAVKLALVAVLIAAAALHDFVVGPRLRRRMRGRGSPAAARRAVIALGWTTFVLSLAVPVLGVAVAELPAS